MPSTTSNTDLKYNLGNEINCCGTQDSTVPIQTYNSASGIAFLYNIGKQITSCDSYIGFSGNQIIQTTLSVKQKYILGLDQCSEEYIAYLASSSSSQVVWCAANPIQCWAQSSSSSAQFCIDYPIACWYNSSSSSQAAWCAANPVPCASSSSSHAAWCTANPVPCASSSSQAAWCQQNPLPCAWETWSSSSSSSQAAWCAANPVACFNSSSQAAWCAANPVPCASSSSSHAAWCAANPVPCASSSSQAAWCAANPVPCASSQFQNWLSSSSSSAAAWCAANPVPCASSSSQAAWCAANPVPCASSQFQNWLSSSSSSWCAANPVPCASSSSQAAWCAANPVLCGFQNWLSSSSSSAAAWCAANPVPCASSSSSHAAWCAANPVPCASSSSQAAWCAANPVPCLEYLYSSSSSAAWCAMNPVICSIINSSSSAAAWCAANPAPCASSSSSQAVWCQTNTVLCWLSSSSSSAAAWCAANPIICASSSSSHAAWCAANPVPCASSSSQAAWCSANPVPCASSQFQNWLSSSSSSSFEQWCESNPVDCSQYNSSSSFAVWCQANPVSCSAISSSSSWCIQNPIACASSSSFQQWCINNPIACYEYSSSSSSAWCAQNPYECNQDAVFMSGCTGVDENNVIQGLSGCCSKISSNPKVLSQVTSQMQSAISAQFTGLVSTGPVTYTTSACSDRPCCVYASLSGQAYITNTVQVCTTGWEDYVYLRNECTTATTTGDSVLTGITLDVPIVINGYGRYNVQKKPFQITSMNRVAGTSFFLTGSPTFTPNCAGGHSCSRARFIPVVKYGNLEISGSPEINLDNVGGTTDLQKVPPGGGSSSERESFFTVTIPQSLNTADFWANSNFYLKCNTGGNCHNGITYVVLGINGTNTTIFNSCVVPGSFNQKPLVTIETTCRDVEVTGQRPVITCVPSGTTTLKDVGISRKFLLPWSDPGLEDYSVEMTDNCASCGPNGSLPETEARAAYDPVYTISRQANPCSPGATQSYATWEDNGPECLNRVLFMYLDTNRYKTAIFVTNKIVPKIGGSVISKIEIRHYNKGTKESKQIVLDSEVSSDLVGNPTYVLENRDVIIRVRVGRSDDTGYFYELDTDFGNRISDVITFGGGMALVLKRVLENKGFWTTDSGPTVDGFTLAGAPFGLTRRDLEMAASMGPNTTQWVRVMFPGSDFNNLANLNILCRTPDRRPWDPTPAASSSSSNFATIPPAQNVVAPLFI